MTATPAASDLYQRYGVLVLRRARALLSDEQAARDATHDVFVKVLSALEDFRQESSPVTWLYRATTNHCLNVLRTQSRQGRVIPLLRADTHQTPVSLDARLSLSTVLARVPDDLREIAVYYYLDQMSHEEIARVTGLSRRTIGNRLVEFHAAARLAAGTLEELAR
ncbi:MAG: sigma-70 family RNA polymerase sigma factor [Myxococcaceae bacterium]|nr:sigma-70 family RNA polymerase sigma factor [Myxococcaceae bacterium]